MLSSKYLSTYSDLEAGDIILFLFSKTPFTSQQFTMFFQRRLYLQKANPDLVHAAICVGKDEKQQPKIAHVYEIEEANKTKKRGYMCHSLQEMLAAEEKLISGNEERTFLIFRPKNKAAAKKLAAYAQDEKLHGETTWSMWDAITTYLSRTSFSFKPTAKKDVNKSLVCSNFVIDCIHAVNDENLVLNVNFGTPMALQKALSNADNYFEKIYYPGRDAYLLLKLEIANHIVRLNNLKDGYSKAKGKVALEQFEHICEVISNHAQLDEIQKCLVLLKTMLPLFTKSTGYFGWLVNTSSYCAISNFARSIGIFQHDINDFPLDKIIPDAKLKPKKNGR